MGGNWRKYVFGGVMQYFAGQRHSLTMTQNAGNFVKWFSPWVLSTVGEKVKSPQQINEVITSTLKTSSNQRLGVRSLPVIIVVCY